MEAGSSSASSASNAVPQQQQAAQQSQAVASTSSSSTSGIASSSARPIIPSTPKKSILKRPPPPTRSFFNLGGLTRDIVLPGPLSRFIPASAPPRPSSSSSSGDRVSSGSGSSGGGLLPSVVPYDAPAVDDQSTAVTAPKKKKSPADLKRAHFILPHLTTVYPISSSAPPSSNELTESRKEIDNKNAAALQKEKEEGAGAWSLGRIEEFYRECCRLRDELALGGVVGALRVSKWFHLDLELSIWPMDHADIIMRFVSIST